MTLAKQAAGLPRFMLDCGWWRNGRRWRKPTLAELGLHQAGVSFANEHSTDGVLPGPADDLALALSLPAKEVAKTVEKLIERKAWKVRPDDDYEIVGFLDHNPSRREVEDDRKRRADRAVKANHQRWHVEKGQPDAECPLCIHEGLLQGSSEDSSHESCAESQWKEGRMDGWIDPLPQSLSTQTEPPASVEEEEDWATIEARKRLANRTSPRPVVDPAKWVRDVAANVRATEERPKPRLAVVRECANPDCVNGWVETEAGGVVRCQCRPAAAS